jgi:hypothetical protein
VTSFYDYGKLELAATKTRFLKLGETWWWESNRKIPINIFLKKEFRIFKEILVTLATKDINIVHGPVVRLEDISKKRIKRRTIQLMRKP